MHDAPPTAGDPAPATTASTPREASPAPASPAPARPSAGWLDRPWRVLWLVGLPFGLALVALQPPFQPADEHPHFFRAFQVSEGGLVAVRQGRDFGAWQPTSLDATARPWKALFYRPGRRADPAVWRAAWGIPLEPSAREFVDFRNTAPYAPVVYLPAVLGIWAGRLAGLPPVGILYLARLADLLAWLAMGALALRWLPRQRWPTLLFLLLPLCLGVATSVSADVVTVGAGALFTALAARLAATGAPPATRTDAVLLVVLGTVVAVAKFAYAPLLLLVLGIPAPVLGGRHRAWLLRGLVLGVGAAVFVGWALVVLGRHATAGDHISATDQAALLLRQPWVFAGALATTLGERGLHLAFTAVGTLGHLDTPIPNGHFLACLFTLLFVTVVHLEDGPEPAPGSRRWLAAGAVLAFLAVPALVYLNSTPVGHPTIPDLGGRYWWPIVPAVLLLLANRRFVATAPRPTRAAAAAFAAASLALTVWVVLRRYWG